MATGTPAAERSGPVPDSPGGPLRPLEPQHLFLRRVALNFAMTSSLILGALFLGAFGYHVTENMGWIDAILNASMILTGMGPVTPLETTAGKLFASAYALFSGVFFLTMAAMLLGPLVHRMLHRFHLDLEEGD